MIDQLSEELVGDVGNDDPKGFGQTGAEPSGQFVRSVVQLLGCLYDPVCQRFAYALVLSLAAENEGNGAS